VENGAVIVALLHIFEKVGDGLGRFLSVEFELDDAVVRMQFDHDGILCCGWE
jgi:hypothetical protein